MPHANAPLTELGRLRLARCVVDDGWPLRRAAERFQVSHTTAARRGSRHPTLGAAGVAAPPRHPPPPRGTTRYRTLGAAGMHDRSSRPHHQPRRTATTIEEHVVRLRRE